MRARADRSSRAGYWMGVTAFAEAVRKPLRTVQRWCKRGTIPARRRGPKLWFVDLRRLKTSDDPAHLEMYAEAVFDPRFAPHTPQSDPEEKRAQ